ncbi:class I SAM-dependent methyltransferase [Facilibium subflavum]|uniref:class I SAM-dependent methyltransferase n=1 Tax=Facilibium subflavum TaxID=2219058 RepID=UPI000E65DDBA|nr:class I SAM-dependent methyltransferase [Facilibium subflavum]
MTNQLDAKYYCTNSDLQKKIAIDLFQYHQFSNDEKILDVGSGDGYITKLMSQYGCITGIDSSHSMINFANEHNSNKMTTFVESTILNYDTKEKYSLITAFNSIYWCGDVDNIFKKIHSLLEKDGKFLIVTYPKESPYWVPIIDLLKKESWASWLDKSIYKHWITSEQYAKIINDNSLSIIKTDASIEEIPYYSSGEYIRYLKGWLPLMFNSNDFPIDDFITELVFSIWGKETEKQVNLSYKKLVLYGKST